MQHQEGSGTHVLYGHLQKEKQKLDSLRPGLRKVEKGR
jgi:hypothetical protein